MTVITNGEGETGAGFPLSVIVAIPADLKTFRSRRDIGTDERDMVSVGAPGCWDRNPRGFPSRPSHPTAPCPGPP